MARRAALAVVAALVAALTACDDGSGTTPSITLTYWAQRHQPTDELNRKLVAEYQAAHPHVRVEFQAVPAIAPEPGREPDVMTLDDDVLRAEYIPGKRLAPLDPAAFGRASAADVETAYVAGTLDGAKGADQQLYGVPSEFDGATFAINRQHFVDAGLDASAPPTTWQQVLDAAKALAGAGHEQPFAVTDSGFRTLAAETGGTLLSADGRSAQLDSPANAEALRTWVKLARSGDPKAPQGQLAPGTHSMAITSARTMAQIRDSDPGTYGRLALAPLPRPDATKPPVTRVHARFWVVNAASAQQAEAWRLVAFLAGRHERWLAEAGAVQPIAGWENCAAAQAMPFIDVIAEAYRHGRYDQVTPRWADVQGAIRTAVDDALRGASPTEALRKANTAIQRTLT